MRSRRKWQFPLILTGLLAVLYLLISLYLPSPRRLTFGVDRNTGEVRLVRNSITFLPVHKFRRLAFERRGEWAQHDGVIRVESAEKIPAKLTFRMRFAVDSNRLPDPKRLVAEGWPVWIGARVAEAVSAVTQQIPIEQLASPGSEFATRRDRLRDTVARHLARSGLRVSAFEIERIEVDREALLRYKRAELRRNVRGAFGRVVLINLEGADWELINELIVDERLPNLKAIINSGASGTLQTIQPTVSPMLATTLATGVRPDRHGIIDFFDPRAQTPVSSASRRVPAVWEIADAFGRNAAVVNWWAAYPSLLEKVSVYGLPYGPSTSDATAPDSLNPRLDAVKVEESTIGYRQIARFLNITASEYERAISGGAAGDPIVMMRQTAAKTWTDHRVGIELYRSTRPAILVINYGGTDVVNHLFGPYHPPLREGIPSDAYRRYWPAVANYYAEIDRLIGEWMRVVSMTSDTTVLITSTYGMRWGRERPKSPPAGESALSAHRNPGIFIAWGNGVAPNRARRAVSIYDVAPTMLALMGLPPAQEMPGQFLESMFPRVPPTRGVTIASYSELVEKNRVGGAVAVSDYRGELQQIGHLHDQSLVSIPLLEEGDARQASAVTPEVWGRYAWLNNSGVELRQQKKLTEATEAFRSAIALNPTRPTAYLNLSIVLLEREFYTQADEALMEAIVRGLPNPEKYFIDAAAFYRENDMPTRSINLLMQARKILPQSYAIAANLGSALAAVNRFTDAQPELERALGLSPSSTLALNNLGLLYLEKEDYGRALDYWNRSVAIDPQQPEIRGAIEAARTRL